MRYRFPNDPLGVFIHLMSALLCIKLMDAGKDNALLVMCFFGNCLYLFHDLIGRDRLSAWREGKGDN